MYIDLSYFRFEFVTHWLTVETPISQVSIFHYVVVILNQTWLVQTHFSHSGMFYLFVQNGFVYTWKTKQQHSVIIFSDDRYSFSRGHSLNMQLVFKIACSVPLGMNGLQLIGLNIQSHNLASSLINQYLKLEIIKRTFGSPGSH